jgi:hypothetical protein
MTHDACTKNFKSRLCTWSLLSSTLSALCQNKLNNLWWPRNRVVVPARQATQPGGIGSLESALRLLKSLKSRALERKEASLQIQQKGILEKGHRLFIFCRLYPSSLQPPRQCLAPTCRLLTNTVSRMPACLSACFGEVSWEPKRRRAWSSLYVNSSMGLGQLLVFFHSLSTRHEWCKIANVDLFHLWGVQLKLIFEKSITGNEQE